MQAPRRTLLAALVALAALVGATACEPETAPGTKRVVVFGDSVPNWAIRDGKAGIDTSSYTFIDGTLAACEGAKGNPPARSRSGAIIDTPDACDQGWPGLYPPKLGIRADVAVVMAGNHAMLDHRLDGTWRHPCHSPFRTWYQADLEGRLAYLKTKAAKVVIVLPAWPGSNSGWIMPDDRAKRADCVRSATRAAASAQGATVVDFGAYLCPTGEASCNTWRSRDGVHVNPDKAAAVMSWLLSQAAPVTTSR